MSKLKPDEIPPEPSLADIASLFRRLQDCLVARFEAAAGERAKIAAQVQEDRHASKSRDMILDGGVATLTTTIDGIGANLGAVRKTQLQVSKRVDTAARKADQAAASAHAVGVKVETISKALGLDGDGKKAPTVATWSPGKAMRFIGVWGSGAFILAKIADAAWHPAMAFIVALWKTAIH